MLDPIQRSFSQLRRRQLRRGRELYLIELLPRKPFGKLPRLQMQWLHAATPALLAKQPRFPGCMKRWLGTKRRATSGALAKLRKPSAQTHSPKRKITQGQLPRPCTLNLANREQKKPEHGLSRFMLRENLLRNFADNCQAGAQLIIALRLMKGFQ